MICRYLPAHHVSEFLDDERYPEKCAIGFPSHFTPNPILKTFVILNFCQFRNAMVDVYTNGMGHLLCIFF